MTNTNTNKEVQPLSPLAAVENGLDALCQPGRTTTMPQLAADIIASLEAAGYVIVPVEATDAMWVEGAHRRENRKPISEIWTAMIEARPR